MIKFFLKPNVLELWTDINLKLWDNWTAFCLFPFNNRRLRSLYFSELDSFNTLIGRCLQFQLAPFSRPFAAGIPQAPLTDDPPEEEAIPDEDECALEDSMPLHTEFETLIYPWHEAERKRAGGRGGYPAVKKVA